MADEARDMSNEKWLAAELVGDELRLSIPKDSLTARLLLEHLRHGIEMQDLQNALAVRAKVASANGIVRGDPRMLKDFRN